jgi:integrase
MTRARRAKRERRLRGTGSVYPRKDRTGFAGEWTAPRNGTGIRPVITVYGPSYSETDDALRDAIRDFKTGKAKPTKTITVKEHFERWLVLKAKDGLKYTSIRAYSQSADLLIPRIGHFQLGELKTADVRIAIENIEEECGAPSAKNARDVLRNALNHGDLSDVLERNPVDRTPPPKVRRNLPKPWSLEEARQFRTFVMGDRLEALWLLETANGPRPAESIAIRWPQVDLVARTITLDEAITWAAGGLPLSDSPKSEAANRTITIDEDIVQALERRKVGQNEEREKARAGTRRKPGADRWLDNDFVFSTPQGRPARTDTILKQFQRLCRAAGVRETRNYDTRRLAASVQQAAGASLTDVQHNHGHSSSALVADTYGYPQQETQHIASARTADLYRNGSGVVLRYADDGGDRPSGKPSKTTSDAAMRLVHARIKE